MQISRQGGGINPYLIDAGQELVEPESTGFIRIRGPVIVENHTDAGGSPVPGFPATVAVTVDKDAAADSVHCPQGNGIVISNPAQGRIPAVGRMEAIPAGFGPGPMDAVPHRIVHAGPEGNRHRIAHSQVVHRPRLGSTVDMRCNGPVFQTGAVGDIGHPRRQDVTHFKLIQITAAGIVSLPVFDGDLECQDITRI